ncbi:glycosyltransferase family 4 protein [Patescibacteria group bacterium]
MAHIGIDAREYGTEKWSGIGRYVSYLVKEILESESEHDFTIFLPDPYYSKLLKKYSGSSKVNFKKVPASYYSWREQLILPFYLNDKTIDLYHFPHFNVPLFFNKPFVATIHDVTPLIYPGHKDKRYFRQLAYKILMSRVVKKSKGLIMISDFTRQETEKHFPGAKDKNTVIHEAIDQAQFAPVPDTAERQATLKKYNITKPFLLYVGVWRYHKNLVRLIKAFENIKTKLPEDYQLVLGGKSDPKYPNVQAAIDKSSVKEAIITPGFIDEKDLAALYSATALFVFPSLYEGAGLPPLEALACKAVVAASYVTATPETIHRQAVFFDPQDLGSIEEALQRGLTDKNLRLKLQNEGFAVARERTWKDVANDTLSYYSRLL